MINCILFLWRRSPGRFAMAITLTILSGFSGIALLAAANIVLQGRAAVSRALVIWSFIGLCLLLPLCRFTAEILISRLAQRAVFELQIDLSRKIAAAPLRFLEEYGADRLLAVLIQDVHVFGFALLTIPTTCLNLTIFTGGLIYLGWLSRVLFATVIGFIVLGLLVYRLPASRAANSLRLARKATDGLYEHLRSLLGGAKELKLHQRRRRAFFSQVLHSSASSVRAHNVSGYTAAIVAASWAQIAGFMVLGALLLAVPLLTFNPQARIGYTMTLIFMMATLEGFLSRDADREFKRAEVALQRIRQLEQELTGQRTERGSVRQDDFNDGFKRLDLIEVTHTYRRQGEIHDFVIGPVSLSLAAGEVVFLVGGNGSGKTTLAKLLVGLYTPETGQVYLNHQIITDLNREHYRRHFSAVFSDFHLFDKLLGMEEPQLDERARGYLSQLELDQEVEIKEGNLSTTQLSQGQRKRLALLTAYMEDRAIYVFDEWAADQDPSFKKIFYYSFLPELRARGKAVVVISHDDRYYNVADRIIRLDFGRIVELTSIAHTANTA